MIPIINSITLLRTNVEKKKMMAITVMAPTKAAARMAAKPVMLTEPTESPPPRNNITSATPSPAPLLIPNTLGPANGLRKAVCNISPLTARAAPQSVAVIACGNRDSSTMNCHEALLASLPKRMLTTSAAGILTDPSSRLRANSTMTTNPSPKQYTEPLFMLLFYQICARCSAGTNILSPFLMPKASYQLSIIGRAAITRRRLGE